jgi:hypothetical protein
LADLLLRPQRSMAAFNTSLAHILEHQHLVFAVEDGFLPLEIQGVFGTTTSFPPHLHHKAIEVIEAKTRYCEVAVARARFQQTCLRTDLVDRFDE